MEDALLCVAANLEDGKDYNTKTAINVAPLYRHAREATFLSTVHIIKKSLEVPQENMTFYFNTFCSISYCSELLNLRLCYDL